MEGGVTKRKIKMQQMVPVVVYQVLALDSIAAGNNDGSLPCGLMQVAMPVDGCQEAKVGGCILVNAGTCAVLYFYSFEVCS